MELRPAYPADTATGSCFITQDYDASEGIIDLNLWLDALPSFGRLCVSPKAVRMMCQTLGIELVDAFELAALRHRCNELAAENVKLRTAMSRIFDARDLVGLNDFEWVRTP